MILQTSKLAAGLAPSVFPTIGSVRDSLQPSIDPPAADNGSRDKDDRPVYICLGISSYWILPIHRLIKKLLLRYNLPWLTRFRMSYHRFPNLAEHFQGILASKLGQYLISIRVRDAAPCNCTDNNGQCILKGAAAGQCRFRNVVYRLRCTFCDQSYIGNTSTPLKSRVNQHMDDVRKCLSDSAGHSAFNSHGLRASSTAFAKHFSRCWRDSHHIVPGATTPSRATLRPHCETSILWQGKALSCVKTYRDWDCRLCQAERLAHIRARFLDPSRQFRSLVNQNLEILGTCPHKTCFHPLALTEWNPSADDPTYRR